jgi:hypothetical protein
MLFYVPRRAVARILCLPVLLWVFATPASASTKHNDARAHKAIPKTISVKRSSPTGAKAAPASGAKKMYWGAWIGDQLTGQKAPWDFSAVDLFEDHAGKNLSLLHFSSPFFDCSQTPCKPYTFPLTPFENIRAHGAIPFFSWNSASWPVVPDEPDFQLTDVAAGRYDEYIRQWATAAARWGHPFFLRFNWEMNGDWFPWAEGVNGNPAGSYVAAWRHVHDIFSSVGARNATWVWCPEVDPAATYTPLSRLYPGDQFVDWTCLDGYAYDSSPSQGFERLFRSAYDEITTRIAPSKPMAVGETGMRHDPQKGAWMKNTFSALSRFPKLGAFLYFENTDPKRNLDYSIETSPASLASFRTGIAAPKFMPNNYGSITQSPIPLP